MVYLASTSEDGMSKWHGGKGSKRRDAVISQKEFEDAWDKILVHQLNIKHKPCNFVELFPRLKEK